MEEGNFEERGALALWWAPCVRVWVEAHFVMMLLCALLNKMVVPKTPRIVSKGRNW